MLGEQSDADGHGHGHGRGDVIGWDWPHRDMPLPPAPQGNAYMMTTPWAIEGGGIVSLVSLLSPMEMSMCACAFDPCMVTHRLMLGTALLEWGKASLGAAREGQSGSGSEDCHGIAVHSISTGVALLAQSVAVLEEQFDLGTLQRQRGGAELLPVALAQLAAGFELQGNASGRAWADARAMHLAAELGMVSGLRPGTRATGGRILGGIAASRLGDPRMAGEAARAMRVDALHGGGDDRLPVEVAVFVHGVLGRLALALSEWRECGA